MVRAMKVRAVPTPLSPVLANVYLHYVLAYGLRKKSSRYLQVKRFYAALLMIGCVRFATKRTLSGSIGCYRSGWRK